MSQPRLARLGLIPVILAAGAVGCAMRGQTESPVDQSGPAPDTAEQPGGAGAPASTAAKTVSDLDALEHDLAVAEQRLETQLVRTAAYRSEVQDVRPPVAHPTDPGPAGTSPVPPGTTPGPPIPEPGPSPTRPTPHQGRQGSPCDIACRALASMRRSADGICELAGENDARCQWARQRVVRATERVAAAGCLCKSDSGQRWATPP